MLDRMKRAGEVKGPRRSRKEHHDLEADFNDEWCDFPDTTFGARQMEREFIAAVYDGSVNRVKTFLDRGVVPTFTILPNRETLLHVAVSHSKPENSAYEKIVRLLLFFGCDPNAVDLNGNTPLHSACVGVKKCHRWIEVLLQAGADVNKTNHLTKETPLLSICAWGHPSVDNVKLLLDSGADASLLNPEGRSVLHLLCKLKSNRYDLVDKFKVVSFLLEQGVPCHQSDVKGKTPLCYQLDCIIYVLLLDASDKKRAHLLSQSVKTAQSLVAGGALFDFHAHEDELKALLSFTMFVATKSSRETIVPLFLSIQNVLPPWQFEFVTGWIRTASLSFTKDYARRNCSLRSQMWKGPDYNDDESEDVLRVNDDDDDDDAAVASSFSHRVVVNDEYGTDGNYHDSNGDVNTSAAATGTTISGSLLVLSSPQPVLSEFGTCSDSDLEHVKLESALRCKRSPSLLALSKMAIRQCLRGRVSYLTPFLRSVLPQKHLEYIKSS